VTDLEIKVAKAIEGDIGAEKYPFRKLADICETDEAAILLIIKKLRVEGKIRRFCAVLRHRHAGVVENALVIWAVPPEQCERVGTILSAYGEVTHCYQRNPPFEQKFNIFSMIHCTKKSLKQFIETVSKKLDIFEFRILASEQEFKKKSMEYFSDGQYF
jgi:DNA-binding Lrp family transcriptional regulator